MPPIGGAGVDIGVGLERRRCLLCHSMCICLVDMVADETLRQFRKCDRRWRRAADSEGHTCAVSVVVDRDLSGGRRHGEVAMAPAELGGGGDRRAPAASRPLRLPLTIVT